MPMPSLCFTSHIVIHTWWFSNICTSDLAIQLCCTNPPCYNTLWLSHRHLSSSQEWIYNPYINLFSFCIYYLDEWSEQPFNPHDCLVNKYYHCHLADEETKTWRNHVTGKWKSWPTIQDHSPPKTVSLLINFATKERTGTKRKKILVHYIVRCL